VLICSSVVIAHLLKLGEFRSFRCVHLAIE
jgi:hypothetical protein